MTVTDPDGPSTFVSDTVFGGTRTVWAFNAASTANVDQVGLTLNTTGLIAPQSYSVDMVFLFTDRNNAWRRIIDVENRQSDAGFYVNPSNDLAVYPIAGSNADWTNGIYHHVVLTNTGSQVKGYIDGVAEFTAPTSLLNLDNASNPSLLMNFFLDNIAAGGSRSTRRVV